ncbi:MAG: ATP-binding cassette domain-containing protein [Hyphomicrobiales bacterium]
MLKLQNISVSYGSFVAVDNISIDIKPGEISTIYGHHGAGKSSLLKAIVGCVKYSGDISFNGQNIQNQKPHHLLKNGIAYMPEGRSVFGKMTISENLVLSATLANSSTTISEAIAPFPALETYINEKAFCLSGGQAQMLSFARLLITNPKYLILDEPTLGLAEGPKQSILDTIIEQSNKQLGILLVEQEFGSSCDFSNQVYEMVNGKIKRTVR